MSKYESLLIPEEVANSFGYTIIGGSAAKFDHLPIFSAQYLGRI